MGILIRISAPLIFKWFINLPTSPDYNASELASWPPCLYVAPHLSPGLSPRFYVLECLGPDPPSASLVDLWSNTKLAILDTQPALRDRLAAMASPQVLVHIFNEYFSNDVNMTRTRYTFLSNATIYYTKLCSQQHVLTLMSHHQAIQRTNPRYVI